jgi:DNA (cytosine-5)-methyltransferase 1
MKVAGLFAGVGGFELGLGREGHHASLLCEILPTAQAVLRERFKDVPIEPDVIAMKKGLPRDIDIVTAGFPCQDLSQAGRTAGLAGHRSGLIGEVFRLLELRKKARRAVPFVIVENVSFMLSLGGGGAMRAIIDELERLGYRWAYRLVDSNGFGLPQRRERVYLVAAAKSTGIDPADILLADDAPFERPKTDLQSLAHGFYWTEGFTGLGWAVDAVPTLKNGSTIGIASPPAVILPDGRIVKPGLRTAEMLQGFDPDWTQPAEAVGKRSLRWALVGNAVSVPIPQWIGGRINVQGQYDRSRDREFPAVGKAPRAARFDGKNRFAVNISSDPKGIRSPHLVDVMGDDFELLSDRAASGFLNRAKKSKLRYDRIEGFLPAVQRHIDAVKEEDRSSGATEQIAA